jgi:hypothetical protein
MSLLLLIIAGSVIGMLSKKEKIKEKKRKKEKHLSHEFHRQVHNEVKDLCQVGDRVWE